MKTARQWLAEYEKRMKKQREQEKCGWCGMSLAQIADAIRKNDDHGKPCANCYYDVLGTLVEIHPIVPGPPPSPENFEAALRAED